MKKFINPVPIFLDSRGMLLFGGRVYIGEPWKDPEIHPRPIYWDREMKLLAPQPVRTLGGVLHNGESPAFVFTENGDYSLRIKDADNLTVAFIPSIAAISDSEAARPLYRFGGFAVLSPIAGECLVDHVAADGFTIAGNLHGCIASVGTPPASDFVLTVQVNGAAVGSMTVHPSGLVTYATEEGLPVSVYTGDVVAVVAPGLSDPTIAHLRFTLVGTI